MGILLVVIAAGLFVVKSKRVPEAEKELASVTSASGLRLVVHRIELGDRMTIRGAEAKWSLAKIAKSSSASTWGFGLVDMETKTENGRFFSATLSREMASLMLLVRVFDEDGRPVSTDELEMSSRGFSQGGRVIRDEKAVFESLDRAHKPVPPWQIDVSDGAGGWLATDGPIIPHASDGRGFVICKSFPRTMPNLELRVRFAGDLKPHVLSVRNPGYAKSFPVWTADSKPWVKDLDEVAVRVEEIGAVVTRGNVGPRIDLAIEPRSDQAADAWELKYGGVGDRFGNRCESAIDLSRMPGARLVRYDYEIVRGPLYRWSANEMTVLGELVWPATATAGDAVAAVVGADGAALGITELSLLNTGNKAFGEFQSLDEWLIRVRVEADSKAGALGSKQSLALMVGNEDRSSGASIGSFEGRWSTEISGRFECEGGYTWAGKITPGQRVRIALPAHRPAVPFWFTFDTAVLDQAVAED